jgi:hypothetical protein
VGNTNSVRAPYAKTPASLRCNFEFGSNVTDVSDVQLKKQNLQSNSTEEGIIIAVKPLTANADTSIRFKNVSGSGVTVVSDVHSE